VRKVVIDVSPAADATDVWQTVIYTRLGWGEQSLVRCQASVAQGLPLSSHRST
jgi:hypothetical protein